MAINQLKDHASNLLVVQHVNFPSTRPQGCGHAEGLSQALTGRAAKGSGSGASGAGRPSTSHLQAVIVGTSRSALAGN